LFPSSCSRFRFANLRSCCSDILFIRGIVRCHVRYTISIINRYLILPPKSKINCNFLIYQLDSESAQRFSQVINQAHRFHSVRGRHAPVMATTHPAFLRAWGNDDIRAVLLSYMDDGTICSLRLTTAECCRLSTSVLFARTRLTFTPSALSRPSRMEALARIGHHIQQLTFSMAHTPSTFLPPLLNPSNGREVQFLYAPHTSLVSESQRPKYGTQELGDVLTQQYPPIFHAATNVPAFIRTMRCMPNLRHLTVDCPDQEPKHRYRRDAVDYALISLRIAVERAPLPKLEKLTLRTIHPSALLYLRHMPGFGSTPATGRRWSQIRKLKLVIDSWDFHGPQPGLDHLKIIDDYVRSFSSHLEKLSITWHGRPGPCPLTLETSPLFKPPRKAGKLFAEVTSPMSPLPAVPSKPAMHFPKLKYLQVRNCTMSASQVRGLVDAHMETVRVFDFQDIGFLGVGTWKEAVEPLTRPGISEAWQSSLNSLGLGEPKRPEGDESEAYESCHSHISPVTHSHSRSPPYSSSHEHNDDVYCHSSSQPVRQSLQIIKVSHKLKKRRVRRRRKVRPETDTDTNTSDHPQPQISAPLRPKISAPILSEPIISVETVSEPTISAPTVASPVLSFLKPTTYSPTPLDSRRHNAPPPPMPPIASTINPQAASSARLPSSIYSTDTPRSLFLPFALPLSPPMTPPSPAGPMPLPICISRSHGPLSPALFSPSPFPQSFMPMPAPLSPPPFPQSPLTPTPAPLSLPSTSVSAVDSTSSAPSPPRNKSRSPTRSRNHNRRPSTAGAAVSPNRSPIGTVTGYQNGNTRTNNSSGASHSPTTNAANANSASNGGSTNNNSNGVQRNLVLEATHQSLADDAEKRISTLRKAREAILTKLTREFCSSNNSNSHPAHLGSGSPSYVAGSSGLVVDSGPGVRGARSKGGKGGIGRFGGRIGGSANTETRRGAPGEQAGKTQLVPLMIFR
jgi:hypothetical protein